MSEICPKCGNDSLMFSNIGIFFGVKAWCLVCDEENPNRSKETDSEE
jgi:uncharacterized protein (DUF983 family)